MAIARQDLKDFYAELKWLGQRVTYRKDLTLEDVSKHLPSFDREPFGASEYLDAIVRKPFGKDDRHIPVAAVSKRYALVQHHEFLDWLKNGVKCVGLKPEKLSTEFWMTDYGERLKLRFKVSSKSFDPGDGHQMLLTAECFNSVDRSCALEIRMIWFRLVCANGLSIQEKSSLRKIHDLVWMNRADPAQFLADQLAQADHHIKPFEDWIAHRVTLDEVEAWADESVAKAWTVEAAARICHIAGTGYDGLVLRPHDKIRPHAREVTSEIEVPGAAVPARNLFDLAQGLSWIASRRQSIEQQAEWVSSIATLINHLQNGGKSS